VAVAVAAVVLAVVAGAAVVRIDQLEDRVASLERAGRNGATSSSVGALERRVDRLDESVVALEARTARVPDVVGLRIGDALNWIGVAGFPSAAAPPGGGLDVDQACIVVRQLPEAGRREQVVTPVFLELAAPPGAPSVRCT
jgi:hypothetical protein